MITIKDDSGTHAKCLLDLFDEEANQLKSAAREVDWERQIAIQLMIKGQSITWRTSRSPPVDAESVSAVAG